MSKKKFQNIKETITNFIKERSYHLVEEEVIEAIKCAVEEVFEQKQIKALFDADKMKIIELADDGAKERNISWVFKFTTPRYLLSVVENHIDRAEREKVFATFRSMKSSIIKARAVGETFHIGNTVKIIDVKNEYEGPLYGFGKQYNIYVESGKEHIRIPAMKWTLWALAKYIYDVTEYCMSINPHRKILRLKKQPKAVVWDINGVNAIMPGDERIKGEDYTGGSEWDVILYNVNQTALEGFQLYVSRRQIDFLVRYLYQHIPEMRETKIRAIAREPGVMAKVLIDVNGSRFRAGKYTDAFLDVSRKLHGEKVEIVYYSSDTEEMLRSALNFDGSIKVDTLNKKAVVITDKKGRVIGRDGVNVKLTGMLTGYAISVMTLEEYINSFNIF